jgi:hypothetical protein
MDVTRRTVGELIDTLITTNIRCWHEQEKLMNTSLSSEQRLDAAIMAQQTNARRTALIRAIDERLGEGNSTLLAKTYG